MRATSSRIAVSLAQQAASGADAQIADVVVATCEHIHAALEPIIGKGSVAVIFMRSLHLLEPVYPWLGSHVQTPIGLGALKITLSEQDGATAAAAGGALLQTIYEVLASLVGASLTEQLLGKVWKTSTGGDMQQEMPPWP